MNTNAFLIFYRHLAHKLFLCYNYSLDSMKHSNYCLFLFILYRVSLPGCWKWGCSTPLWGERGRGWLVLDTASSSWLQQQPRGSAFEKYNWERVKCYTFSEEWGKKGEKQTCEHRSDMKGWEKVLQCRDSYAVLGEEHTGADIHSTVWQSPSWSCFFAEGLQPTGRTHAGTWAKCEEKKAAEELLRTDHNLPIAHNLCNSWWGR